jgi:hypothetical protein
VLVISYSEFAEMSEPKTPPFARAQNLSPIGREGSFCGLFR